MALSPQDMWIQPALLSPPSNAVAPLDMLADPAPRLLDPPTMESWNHNGTYYGYGSAYPPTGGAPAGAPNGAARPLVSGGAPGAPGGPGAAGTPFASAGPGANSISSMLARLLPLAAIGAAVMHANGGAPPTPYGAGQGAAAAPAGSAGPAGALGGAGAPQAPAGLNMSMSGAMPQGMPQAAQQLAPQAMQGGGNFQTLPNPGGATPQMNGAAFGGIHPSIAAQPQQAQPAQPAPSPQESGRSPFERAFAAARAANQPTFQFQGKLYNTQQRGAVPAHGQAPQQQDHMADLLNQRQLDYMHGQQGFARGGLADRW